MSDRTPAGRSGAGPTPSHFEDPRIYRRLVRGVEDLALFALDGESRVATWHPAAARLLGREPASVQGRPFAVLFGADDEAARVAEDLLARAGREGSVRWEGALAGGDGRPVPVHLRVWGLEPEADGGSGWAVRLEERLGEQAVERLRRSERRFRLIAENIADIFYVIEPSENRVLYVSPMYEELWGRSRESLYERTESLLEQVHPDDRPRLADKLRRQRGGEAVHIEYRVIHPSGDVRWIHDRAFPVRSEEDAVYRVVGVAEDVTERKRRERSRRFLVDASAVLASSLDYRETLATVCRLAVREMADACAVHLLEEDGEVRCVEVESADPERAEEIRRVMDRSSSGGGPYRGVHHAARTGRSQLVAGIPGEGAGGSTPGGEGGTADRAEPEEGAGTGSAIFVPLPSPEGILGALALLRRRGPAPFDAPDLETAEELGRRAGMAVANARLHSRERMARREAERAAARTARLQDITTALSGTITPADVGQVIVREGVAALGASTGVLAVVGDPPDALRPLASSGVPRDVLDRWRTIPLDADVPLAEAVREQRPVFVSPEERDRRYPGLHGARKVIGSGALAAVPLVGEEQVVGALGFSLPDPRLVTEEDRQFLLSLARQCAQSLQRARLHAAEEEARREAESAHLRVRTVLESIADGFLAVDGTGRISYANQKAAELAGISPDELRGSKIWTHFPQARGSVFENAVRRVVETGRPGEVEGFYGALERWFALRIYPWVGRGVAVYFRDVTERRARQVREKMLSDAGAVLATSLDYEETLRQVALLTVPLLADYCEIHVVDDVGILRTIARTGLASGVELPPHGDGGPPATEARGPAWEAFTAGEVVRGAVGDAAALERMLGGEAAEQEGSEASVLAVPLRIREEVFGVFLMVSGTHRYDPEDVVTAQELAYRTALAVDNSRLFRQTETARREAESASRAKTEFLAVMSHELRTPLNAIVGYGDLLEGEVVGPVNPKQKQHLARIRESAWHLLSLIDEILSFSRLEAGREHLALETVDVAELLRNAAALVEPQAARQGLELDVELPPGSVTRVTDPAKLRQIVLNLLSNALKFTDHGHVRIALQVDGESLRVEVEDTGTGIPPEEHEAVFEPFVRGESVAIGQKSGTGLGLAVTRRFARLLGGDVSIESAPGRGSRFRVHVVAREPVSSTVAAVADPEV